MHQKLEHVSSGFTAEAVEEALVWNDLKGWRLFIMKWAESHVILAAFAKRDKATDVIDDVDFIFNAFDNWIGAHSYQMPLCCSVESNSNKCVAKSECPAQNPQTFDGLCVARPLPCSSKPHF